MDIFIGIDGGGTKSLAVAIDKDGKELGRYQSGCSNKNSVGAEKAKEAIYEAINKVIEEVKQKCSVDTVNVKYICSGMSGVDRDEDKVLVGGWLRDLLGNDIRYSLYNDAVIALAAGTGGHLYGVVLISGTGCISTGFDKSGRVTRSAGWGPLLGDIGSGYQIGFDLCQAVCRAKDQTGPATTLTAALLTELKLETESQLIPWAYNPETQGWNKFAALAPLATTCALNGDQVAIDILKNSAKNLSDYVSSIIVKLQLEKEETIPLVLAGGIIERKCLLTDYLSEILQAKYPNISIKFPQCNSATGAALLALNQYNKK
ncbi:hypothetical protein DLAC_08523 [Tieghemostelium lacteum]|uniref:N-acetyl-D-glucosamine kinase n=1 Tax=Tieghemostelium lacteum TaxID=361077 RepID=A0A151Z7L2_TIELA|nr:hypothetical protein DLAC_08523 [Tieghemostelium lacteum]|eukprot:KYQ89952.1 hypothetical protein DLAC_08523 [Tieghemostelium lacteum]